MKTLLVSNMATYLKHFQDLLDIYNDRFKVLNVGIKIDQFLSIAIELIRLIDQDSNNHKSRAKSFLKNWEVTGNHSFEWQDIGKDQRDVKLVALSLYDAEGEKKIEFK